MVFCYWAVSELYFFSLVPVFSDLYHEIDMMGTCNCFHAIYGVDRSGRLFMSE